MLILLWGCSQPAGAAAPRTATAAQIPIGGSAEQATSRPPDDAMGPAADFTTPDATDTPAVPTSTATAERTSISLAFAGDIMLGRSLADRILRGEGGTIFASAEPILQSADFTVGNLECAIGEGGKKAPKAYTFLAPSGSAGVLQGAGFDLLSLANNHILDYGVSVLEQTERLLDEAGIRHVGAGMDESLARAPVVVDLHGFRLAFLAYVEVPVEYYGFDPSIWAAGPSSPGVSWAEDDKIAEDIRAADPQADFVIVLLHFGDEGVDVPNKRQRQLSRLAVDNGADLIVGSHSHMLQGSEEYNQRWIFYSLGNFVFDEFSGKANRSAVLRVTLFRNGTLEYSLLPMTIVEGVPLTGD